MPENEEKKTDVEEVTEKENKEEKETKNEKERKDETWQQKIEKEIQEIKKSLIPQENSKLQNIPVPEPPQTEQEQEQEQEQEKITIQEQLKKPSFLKWLL